MTERVLIIGNGGREAALRWKLSQSPEVEYVENVPYTSVEDTVNFARQKQTTFIVIGPEDPLAQGIVNRFNQEKIPVFGPTKEAARLEWDKAWSVKFMTRHSIPHPESQIFSSYDDSLKYVQSQQADSLVIKASGLASGKGVILPESQEEAELALAGIFQGKYRNQDTVVIQERLTGREVSLICLTDGTNIVPLLPAQDHKRLKDNDQGPNTGGMGAFVPTPLEVDDQKQIMETIVLPTINGLRKKGIIYAGALYFGLMLTSDGPKVLEYNCRFGDPETQPQMMLFSSDLYSVLKACVDGNLTPDLISFRQGAAVCVVLASEGYPQKPVIGREIHGLDTVTDPDVVIFHSAADKRGGKIITTGGRVLTVNAYGQNLEEAGQKAYSQIGKNGINFEGMQYRLDIGVNDYSTINNLPAGRQVNN